MALQTIKHQEYVERIPKSGRHILAQQTNQQIIVYQAYNHSIADFAVKNQYFGGSAYSYNRMSWIKPNFLWMMYRCGWAQKQNQERVVGIWIDKTDFDLILGQSVFSSFQEQIHGDVDTWKQALSQNPARLQWDPDHDIYGNKQERKAIQLGIKGHLLKKFGTEMINKIVDLTDFVKEQASKIKARQLDQLLIPQEEVYVPSNVNIQKQIGLLEP